jgi:hypothetical protein
LLLPIVTIVIGGLLMGCGADGSDEPEAQTPDETSTVDASNSVETTTYTFTMVEGTGVEVQVRIDLAPIMVANDPELTDVWSSIINGHPETADCAENQTMDGVFVGAITFTNESGFEPDYLGAQFFSPAHEFGSGNAFGLEADAGGTICRSLQGGAISGGYSGSIPFQIVLSDLYGPNGFDQDRFEEQLRLFVTVDSSNPGSYIEAGTNTTTDAPEVDDERDLVMVLPGRDLEADDDDGSDTLVSYTCPDASEVAGILGEPAQEADGPYAGELDADCRLETTNFVVGIYSGGTFTCGRGSLDAVRACNQDFADTSGGSSTFEPAPPEYGSDAFLFTTTYNETGNTLSCSLVAEDSGGSVIEAAIELGDASFQSPDFSVDCDAVLEYANAAFGL